MLNLLNGWCARPATVLKLLAIVFIFSLSGCSAHASRPWLERAQSTEVAMGIHNSPHQVALLSNGRVALRYRLDLINAARHSVRIQTFILGDDPVARLIINSLERAAQRGIHVQLLVDAIPLGESAAQLLARASLNEHFEVRLYNPVPDMDLSRMNQRMHNKVMVVDERIALTGGRNLADEYYDADENLNFLDLDIAIKGAAVDDMKASFDDYWLHGDELDIDVGNEIIITPYERSRIIEALNASLDQEEMKLEWFKVNKVAFWADPPGKPDPKRDPRSFTLRLASLVATAQDELVIQTPYFVLSNNAQLLFSDLRRRNVRVSLSTNSLASTDSWLTYAHALRQRRLVLNDLEIQVREIRPYPEALPDYVPGWLNNTGITNIYSEKPPRLCLHNKALVQDDRIAMVGSYNLDPRSANYNTEVGIVIWDEQFANALRNMIERQMSPGNIWVVARKSRALPLDFIYDFFEQINAVAQDTTTLDIWPLRYSSLYEPESDGETVSPNDPNFYIEHRDVGLFPDVPPASKKIILVELTRMFTGAAKPLL